MAKLILICLSISPSIVLAGGSSAGLGESIIIQRAGGGGGGSVTFVGASAPITSSGGTTPSIGCTSATTGTGGCLTSGSQIIPGAKTFDSTLSSSVASGSIALGILSGARFDLNNAAPGTNYLSFDGTNLAFTGAGITFPGSNNITFTQNNNGVLFNNGATTLSANGSNGLILGGTQKVFQGASDIRVATTGTFNFGVGTTNYGRQTVAWDSTGVVTVSAAVVDGSVPAITIKTTNTYSNNGAYLVAFVNNATTKAAIDNDGSVLSGAQGFSSTLASGSSVINLKNGALANGVMKISIGITPWNAAALTQTLTLGTIPAKSRIKQVYSDTTTAYAGSGMTGAITLKIGTTSGGQELILDHDVKTATVTKGLLGADMGASVQVSGNVQLGVPPSWSTQQVFATLTSAVGNIGNGATTSLTTGSTTYYIEIEAMP